MFLYTHWVCYSWSQDVPRVVASVVPFTHYCYLLRISLSLALNFRFRTKSVSFSGITGNHILLNKDIWTSVIAWLGRKEEEALIRAASECWGGQHKQEVFQNSFLFSQPSLQCGREHDSYNCLQERNFLPFSPVVVCHYWYHDVLICRQLLFNGENSLYFKLSKTPYISTLAMHFS